MQQPVGRACTHCGEYKLFGEFNKARNGTHGYESVCRECKKAKYFENRDARLANNRAYYQDHRDKWSEYNRQYRNEHREEIKEYKRNYYLQYREEIRAERKEWEAQNPDRVRQWRRNDYLRHKEQYRRNGQRWRDSNPDAARAAVQRAYRKDIQKSRMYAISKAHKRRARMLYGGSYTIEEWQSMLDWFGDACLCCGASDTKITVDHVVPVIRYGANTIDNLQPLCKPCNSRKGAKTIDYRDPDSLADFLEMLNRQD